MLSFKTTNFSERKEINLRRLYPPGIAQRIFQWSVTEHNRMTAVKNSFCRNIIKMNSTKEKRQWNFYGSFFWPRWMSKSCKCAQRKRATRVFLISSPRIDSPLIIYYVDVKLVLNPRKCHLSSILHPLRPNCGYLDPNSVKLLSSVLFRPTRYMRL